MDLIAITEHTLSIQRR